MKILITGANGRIGRILASKLVNDFDLVLTSREDSALIAIDNATYYKSDITKSSQIQEIFEKERPDIVIHMAGIMGDVCEKNHGLAFQVNVEATRNIGQIAAKIGVKKFIFASSAAVYPRNLNRPLEEEDANPQNYYGQTKLEAEKALETIAMHSDMQVVILRIFNIYGPNFNDSLVNKLIASLDKDGDEVELVDPENFYRDYIHIDDVVETIARIINNRIKESFLIYNIASGICLSTEELISILQDKYPSGHFKYKIANGNNPSFICADTHIGKEILANRNSRNLFIK